MGKRDTLTKEKETMAYPTQKCNNLNPTQYETIARALEAAHQSNWAECMRAIRPLHTASERRRTGSFYAGRERTLEMQLVDLIFYSCHDIVHEDDQPCGEGIVHALELLSRLKLQF